MSQIKGKNTKPEMLVRRFLHANGFRYKLHDKSLPGKPDIVLPKYKTVIFVHGCFWHGHHDCKDFKIPKTRTEWWSDKIRKNVAKDILAQEALELKGWRTIIIWGCDLEGQKRESSLALLITELFNPQPTLAPSAYF